MNQLVELKNKLIEVVTMAKEVKANKVQVNKGPIVANQETLKTITPEKRARDDNQMCKDRYDGQTLKFHTPKK